MSKSLLKLFLLLILVMPFGAFAGDLTVRPFLIDRTVEAREFLGEEVTLSNNTGRQITVYATVNEITVDSEGEIKKFVSPIMTDRTNTVTSWVEITRGRITLTPGETTTIPLGFRIHPQVQPGEYHVFIGFGAASKRYQAEQAAMEGEVDGVIAKLTIEDESTEYLRIAGFMIDRFVTTKNDRRVQIELENLGDVTANPKGEIIFFNSNGEELEAIPVNTEQLSILPGETVIITSELPFGNKLGRFKANLSLQYGDKQRALLYDTTQFFMMPLHIMLLMLFVAVLLTLLLFILLHRVTTQRETPETGHELPFTVREGHNPSPKHHDIDLSKSE